MNVPKLRFEGFSDEWNAKRTDSFLEKISKSVKVNPEEFYTEIGIRSHGKGIFHKEPIKGSALGDKRVFHIVADALVLNIVFAWEHAVARTSALENGMIASHRFPMFLPKNQQSSTAFLKYLFLTKKGKYYLELASPGGAGRNKTLGQKNFDELLIDLPTLPEQNKIANFLTAIDDKIAHLSKKSELLKQYKNGLMQQIFSQKIRFKDDEGRDFGEWVERKIKDIATIVGGGTPDTMTTEFWGGEIQWFTPTELKSKYTTQSIRTITSEGLKKSSAKILPIGTLLFSSRATVGDVSIALTECTTNQGFQSFIVNSSNSNQFVYYWIKNNKNLFIEKANGSTFLEISKGEIEKLIISCPSYPEQIKIANFFTALDDQINHATAELAAVKQYKQGLLQQMFV